jgi:hypothetical protein
MDIDCYTGPKWEMTYFVDSDNVRRPLRYSVRTLPYKASLIPLRPYRLTTQDYYFMGNWSNHCCHYSLCPCGDQALRPTLRAFGRQPAVEWIYRNTYLKDLYHKILLLKELAPGDVACYIAALHHWKTDAFRVFVEE